MSTLRFASTIPGDSSSLSSAEEPFPVPADDFMQSSLQEITSDLPSIPERIGYLKDLGLDYGWGPTALIQWLVEHIHVLTATPWWASALLAALCVRLVLLKPYIEAADTSARLVTMKEIIEPIQARVRAAKLQRDQQEMMLAANEIRALYRSAGIKPWKIAIPFIQVPVGFGTFRLFRGMVNLPVPGLEQGGLLWIQDLTLSDPYFVLPVVCALAVHTTFRLGSEFGSTPASAKMRSLGLYILPVVVGGFMVIYPALMQLTFTFTALLGLMQAYCFRQPWIRQRLGIQPLPVKPEQKISLQKGALYSYAAPTQTSSNGTMSSDPNSKGLYGRLTNKARQTITNPMSEVRGAVSELKKTMGDFAGNSAPEKRKHGRTAAELRQAKAYEEKYRKRQEARRRAK